MAAFKSLRCESCGATLHVDGSREYTFCEYCGAQNFLDPSLRSRYAKDYDEDDDDDEDRGYRGPYDKDLEMERMKQKERESIRDNQLILGMFGFIALMFIFGAIFGL